MIHLVGRVGCFSSQRSPEGGFEADAEDVEEILRAAIETSRNCECTQGTVIDEKREKHISLESLRKKGLIEIFHQLLVVEKWQDS